MQVHLYRLTDSEPLEDIGSIVSARIETITAEIQVLHLRYSSGELKAREIDSTQIGIHITQE